MKVGYIHEGYSGVDYHRLHKPFSLLGNDMDVFRCEGATAKVFDHNFDAVVFSRRVPLFGEANKKDGTYFKTEKFIKELKNRGTYVICDIDDHWLLNTAHVAKGISEFFKRQSIEALINSDEIWVTHEHLGKAVDRLNQNWHVVPNAIDPNEAQWQPKTDYQNRIGWAGGVTHFADLMLTDGCYTRPPVIAGYNQKEPEWKRLADNFTAVYVEALDVWNYGHLYEQFDIAIAPLVDNKFNTYKSNLKIIEAGMKGLPIFVQNIHPYTDDCKGIFKVENWKDAISKAEGLSKDTIMEEGQALRLYAIANYNIHDINEKRKERLE